jgi:MBOAT, membrane-bound O-acyltransferase family
MLLPSSHSEPLQIFYIVVEHPSQHSSPALQTGNFTKIGYVSSRCNHVSPQRLFSSANIFLGPASRFIIDHIRWNSTSWDEFARKWNKPVHVFLLRHVYAATIMKYRVSRSTAMLLTFLLSACVHELVMAVVTRKFR